MDAAPVQWSMAKPPFVCLVCRRVLAVLLLSVGLVAVACSDSAPSTPEIRFVVPPDHPDQAVVTVVGIPSHYLPASGEVTAAQWPEILRATVSPKGIVDPDIEVDVPPVAGSYSVSGNAVTFKPMFGFEPGVWYRVQFDGARLPATANVWKPDLVVSMVGLPKKDVAPTTSVERIYPSADVVPENQLRLYVHFTAPMGRKGGVDFVHLLDDQGKEVKQAFLPLEAELWNSERTRYTVFFDPGRVKRGILPNQQMGRPLKSGHQFTLVIDRGWPDGNGNPLTQDFRRTFKVGPPDTRPLDTRTWVVHPPSAGSWDPLIVTFPEPLDHGLLMRALGVESGGRARPGEVSVLSSEREWRFAPIEPWQAGDYQLVALTILEDMAGNRIGRAFEVDQFEETDSKADQDRVTIPFQIGR